jgi:hypothetical protein
MVIPLHIAIYSFSAPDSALSPFYKVKACSSRTNNNYTTANTENTANTIARANTETANKNTTTTTTSQPSTPTVAMYFGITSHDVHDGHTHLEAPAIGISGDLFDLNCKLFRSLRRSDLCSDKESDEAWLADNEAGRFRLWGDGFDAKEGGLHELLEHSSLGGTVVSLLVGVARKLQKCEPWPL